MKRRRTREEIQADFNAWIIMGRLKDAKRAEKLKVKESAATLDRTDLARVGRKA